MAGILGIRGGLRTAAQMGLVRFHHMPRGVGALGGGGGSQASTFKKMTIFDVGARFRDKTVLIRVDYNGATSAGQIKSTDRLDASLPTIQCVLEQGAERIYLISHNGRYQQITADGAAKYSLVPAAGYLAEKLNMRVGFTESFSNIASRTERVVVGPNTREDARDEAEDAAQNEAYAKEILAVTNPDIFVLDGFSVAHRNQASVTWPAKLMQQQGKMAVAGKLLLDEYTFFVDKVIKDPARPFLVFLGGAKVSGIGGKLPILEALLPNVTTLVVGGAMAYPFLRAQGYEVGVDPLVPQKPQRKSGEKEQDFKVRLAEHEKNVEIRKKELKEDEIPAARRILKNTDTLKLVIPTLLVGQDRKIIDVSRRAVPKGFVMKDVRITNEISRLRAVGFETIFGNGTFGAYEQDKGGHVEGTHEFLRFMSEMTEAGGKSSKGAITIPGGGDTITVLKGLKKAGKLRFTHETTGGGASGELIVLGFQGRPQELPGFACLTHKN